MQTIKTYLGCGHVYKNKDVLDYKVSKFSDLTDKIIPFFKEYPGVKSKEFADFCRVAELIKDKKHLTPEGLEKILEIKAGMNRGRNKYN